MKKVITSTLLKKDIPNPNGKNRLYYILFFNEVEMYVVGKSIQDCIDNNEFKCNIKRFHTIDSWRDLLQKQGIKFEHVNHYSYINMYKRTCYKLPCFNAYFDEFNNEYYIVNHSTKDCITLK